MITTMFFVLVPFLKRDPRIVIHLARNAEKGGGVLMGAKENREKKRGTKAKEGLHVV